MSKARKLFLEARRSGIGGSDVGPILGVDRFKNILDVYNEKVGLAEPKPDEDTGPMARGRDLEDIVFRKYRKKSGRKANKADGLIRHTVYDWAIANVDGIITANADGRGPGVLECKAPGLATWGAIKRDGLPQSWMVQMQHYLWVCGCSWGAFAIMNAESWDILIIEVARDGDWLAKVYPTLHNFWHWNVVSKNVPEVPETAQAQHVPTPPGETVDVSKDKSYDFDVWSETVDLYETAKRAADEADHLLAAAKTGLRLLLGDTPGSWRVGDKVVTLSSVKGRTTDDSEAMFTTIKSYQPDAERSAYQKTGAPSERLTVKTIAKKEGGLS